MGEKKEKKLEAKTRTMMKEKSGSSGQDLTTHLPQLMSCSYLHVCVLVYTAAGLPDCS